MTIRELVEITGVSRTTIYKLCKELGYRPSVDEIINREKLGYVKQTGRPPMYRSKEEYDGK
jgi:DNA-binding MurR/RpiR family transcriptional regulator